MGAKNLWFGGAVLLLLGGAGFFLFSGGEADLPGVEASGGGGREEAPPRPSPPSPEEPETAPKRVSLAPVPEPGTKEKEPPPSSEVAGRVVDGRGRGIAGIEVILLRCRAGEPGDVRKNCLSLAGSLDDFRARTERWKGRLSPEKIAGFERFILKRMGFTPAGETRSGREGRFRMALPASKEGGKELLVLTAKPGKDYLSPEPIPVDPSSGKPGREYTLVLLRPASLEGTILSLPGGGNGGTILAFRIGRSRVLEEKDRFILNKSVFNLSFLRPGRWRLAYLDQWGRPAFSWGPLVELREGERRTNLVLKGETPSSLEVRFYGPDRSPLPIRAGGTIFLAAAGPPGKAGWEAPLERVLFRFSVEPGKTYQNDRLSPGRYRISAGIGRASSPSLLRPRGGRAGEGKKEKKDGSSFQVEKTVVLKPGPNRVELVFPGIPPLFDLQVSAVDSSGRPLAEGTVQLWPSGRGSFGGRPIQASLGRDGSVFLREIGSGRYTLVVRSPGYWGFREHLEFSPGGDPLTVRRCVLHREGRIEGVLLDRDGSPLAGKHVLARRRGKKDGLSGNYLFSRVQVGATDEKGRFLLLVPQGEYDLMILGESGPHERKPVRLGWGETVKVEMRPAQ